MKTIKNFPLINFDTNIMENIISQQYKDFKKINFLGKIDDIDPNLNTLTFASNSDYFNTAKRKGFSFILYNENIDDDSVIYSKNPRSDFLKIIHWINKNGEYELLNPSISSKISVGQNVKIGNNVVIEDGVKIGNNVVIEDNCFISKDVIIDDFAKIGGYGFEIENSETLQLSGIHGGVFIGENSFIKNFTNIDRSVWGLNTIINSNVAIDSHVLIGHDVFVGDNSQIRGGSVVAGFSKIGNNSVVGIGTNFLQRSSIGNDSLTSANSIITKNFDNNSKIIAQPSKVFKNN